MCTDIDKRIEFPFAIHSHSQKSDYLHTVVFLKVHHRKNSVSNQYNQCFFQALVFLHAGLFAFCRAVTCVLLSLTPPQGTKQDTLSSPVCSFRIFSDTKGHESILRLFRQKCGGYFYHVSRSGQVPRCNKISMSDKSYPVPCKPASSYTYVSLSFSQDNH